MNITGLTGPSELPVLPAIELENCNISASPAELQTPIITKTAIDSKSPETTTGDVPCQRADSRPGQWISRTGPQHELKLPCWLLDTSTAVKDFFGRDDTLFALDEMLVVPEGDAVMSELKTVAICGIGGIGLCIIDRIQRPYQLMIPGKTSIASHFVQTRKEKFDAIFWLNADTAGKLDDSFGKIALKLNLQEPSEDRDKLMSRSLVLKWLADPAKSPNLTTLPREKARWLLVFDNVDDFDLMRHFWPPSGPGSVLLTSRDPLVELCAHYSSMEQDKSVKVIHLQPFNDSEGADFLHRLTRRSSMTKDEKAAKDVARRLQGLPLALRQLAGIMARRHLTFNDMFGLYDEEHHHKSIYEAWEHVGNADYQHNIATVWGLEKLESGALMLMNVLSFFDPDHIQEEILKEGAPQVKAKDYPKSGFEYSTSRTGLWKSSLVNLERNLKRDKDDQNISEDPSDITNNTITERVIAADVDPEIDSEAAVAEDILPELSVHRVVQDAARAKMNEQQLKEAFEAVVTLLLICESHLEVSEEILLEIHTSLGCIATEINDPNTCFKHYELLLKMTKEKFVQPKKTEEFDALMVANNEMGIAHMMVGHVYDAYELFEDARHMAQIHSMDRYGSQYEAAMDTLTQAWGHHFTLLTAGGVPSFAPGRIAHAIGNVKDSQGDAEEDKVKDEALDWFQQAYNHYRNTIGLYHHRTADVFHKLAMQYVRVKDPERAYNYINHAIEVFKSRTHYKPELARSMNLKSMILRGESRTEEADEIVEESLVVDMSLGVEY
ncbi:hypothetical protein EJ04DRAFT_561953 [Polyplosphaeria fusca]|uniref:DUF7779 domain-containing protein n=1 Tax=Polyplosphaeria fusca TaxID=682080 RepID=A0A9P4R5E2_9PLEO|nr:hypothetical protein EJ04DRAFT_561953 [Polyplosphaeria fusca]